MNSKNTFWSVLSSSKIVIPQLQRDYAQGRKTEAINRIRKEFINTLFCSLTTGSHIELDFIYGNTICNNSDITKFTPLDGQQRLTTLFLLHCFTAIKAQVAEDAKCVLNHFGYETRHSSRLFCEQLIENLDTLSVEKPIDETIKNQSWYMSSWRYDPTIKSMLVVLHDIQMLSRLHKPEWIEIWNQLISEQCPVSFHFLPMNKFDLSDDLYIKMNARGKPLTEFEIFKSRLAECIPDTLRSSFSHKADTDWSDLFWDLTKDIISDDIAKNADAAFMRCLQYITSLLLAKNKITLSDNEEHTQLQIYKEDNNAIFLFNVLDFFRDIVTEEYFETFFYVNFADFSCEKVRLFGKEIGINLLMSCALKFDNNERINPFSLREQLLLYACYVGFSNRIENSNFRRRLRYLRNLLDNSVYQLRRENFSILLENTEELIISGRIDSEYRFNPSQITEERQKQAFLTENPELTETVFRLEDNHLLRGAISIIKLDSSALKNNVRVFNTIFAEGMDKTSYDLISCALMATGIDYARDLSKPHRKLYGTGKDTTWRDLFTQSNERGEIDKISAALKILLKIVHDGTTSGIPHADVLTNTVSKFVEDKAASFSWNHYFIKYDTLRFKEERNGFEGVYYIKNSSNPYSLLKLNKRYANGHHWDPFLLAVTKEFNSERFLRIDNFNNPLQLYIDDATIKITSLDKGFLLSANDQYGEDLLSQAQKMGYHNDGNLIVNQTSEGIDTEDRIEKLVKTIKYLRSISTNISQ